MSRRRFFFEWVESRRPDISRQHPRVAIVTSIHPDFDSRIWKHACSLAEAGCRVWLVCPWRVAAGEIREGVEVRSFRRVEHRLLRPLLIPFRLGRQLLPLVSRVDIVHFHDLDLLPWMAILSLLKPVVYDIHENYPDEMAVREWVPRWLRQPLYHAVRILESAMARVVGNCVLAVPAQASRFRTTDYRIVHVRNYASRRLLAEVRDDYLARRDRVVFTGGHHTANGSLLLLDIAARCRRRGLDLEFLVTDRFATEGFRRLFLERRERLGVVDNVIVSPYLASYDIMKLLNEATIGISPNLRVPAQEKAIPTKLFEYMAAGLPIVTSDLPAQIEIVGGAEAGILARPEQPETFVEALAALVADRQKAWRLGLNGQRAFLDRYCWETQIASLLEFYDGVLTGTRAAMAVR